jgi:uncharacterized membrane protein YbhN (UPF0104 family)
MALAGAAAGDRLCGATPWRPVADPQARTIAGAFTLIAFLFGATPLYHNLFLFKGKDRDPHLYLTLVNITLVGGLLLIIADAL